MSVIYLLLPLGLLLSAFAVGVFVWAVTHDQFEDLETPRLRILQDDQGSTTVHKDPNP